MTRNTFGDAGMAVAADDKGMKDGDWQNDTRKPKWTVDLDANPPHLKIIDNLGGGTIKTYGVADAGVQFQETLFEMKHKMPWPPAFLCYFFIKDAPAGFSTNIGKYAQSTVLMVYNNFPVGTEGLYAKVTDKVFRIVHFIDVDAPTGNYTFAGDNYKFRVKFELLNQEALFLGGPGF